MLCTLDRSILSEPAANSLSVFITAIGTTDAVAGTASTGAVTGIAPVAFLAGFLCNPHMVKMKLSLLGTLKRTKERDTSFTCEY